MQLIFFPSLMGKRMYSFYIWGVRRCAEKENLEWGKQVGNNRENETEIDLLQLAKALWHKAWAIVLVTLITAAMAFAGTKLFITPLYTASAMMYVEIPEEARKELDERFCLIYTGQRRLARNLLRDVIGRYVGNEPDSVFALEEIQKVAALMRFELERGNVDGFAKLLDYHWELSKKVDAGSSNTLIEQIFSSIDELIDGRLVCGAGGGGFLQVVLKKGVTKKQVAERLHEVFMDSLVDVADCKLLWE